MRLVMYDRTPNSGSRAAQGKLPVYRHPYPPSASSTPLPIALRNTLQLVLFLDRIAVAAAFGSVDQLFSQALSNALDVAERRFAGTDGKESDGLVDAAERRHIDGLATDGTGGTDTGAVFAGAAVHDGVNGDLDGVLVGHDVDLLNGEQSVYASFANWYCGLWNVTYDFEGVGDDADGLKLLAVVAAVHHERVGETLDDGALSLPEALDGIAAGGMGDVDGLADLDVVSV
jgi:hypothetical protein